MAERGKYDTLRTPPQNPLLSSAGVSFPFENFTRNTILMPAAPEPQLPLPEDAEQASFVGQEFPETATITSRVEKKACSYALPFVLPQEPYHTKPPPIDERNQPASISETRPVVATAQAAPPALLETISLTADAPSPPLIPPPPTTLQQTYNTTSPFFIPTSNQPLLSGVTYTSGPPIPPPQKQGTGNAYRLGGKKRPVYAQPPGILSQSSNKSRPLNPTAGLQGPPLAVEPLGVQTLTPFSINLTQPVQNPSNFYHQSTVNFPPKPSTPQPLPEHIFVPSTLDQTGLPKPPTPPSTGEQISPTQPEIFTPSTQILNPSPTNYFTQNPNPELFAPIAPPPPSLSQQSNLWWSSPLQPQTTNIQPHLNSGLTMSTPTASLPPVTLEYHSPVSTSNSSSPTLLPPSFTHLSLGHTYQVYQPVTHHWFYKKNFDTTTNQLNWTPFSFIDSQKLEDIFISNEITPETIVATDGGRYDVDILRRQKTSVYWEEESTEVRRCSWFYKGASDGSQYQPYDENTSTLLEEEFRQASTTNEWHRRVELPNNEAVVFHGPGVIVHFIQSASPADVWGNAQQTPRPKVVKRGIDEFEIEQGESTQIDHLLFLVHGIGSFCDLKFRKVEAVVNDFRKLSHQLVQSHFKTSIDNKQISRIEVLPVSWHSTLHGDDTGIDEKLKSITLHSIPKLRDFTNDTLLDILFYSSPLYCQMIMQTVSKELNRIYDLFLSRNPQFKGGISLGGHSLGSLILFDLLYHQKPHHHQQQNQQEQHHQEISHTEPQSGKQSETTPRESSTEPDEDQDVLPPMEVTSTIKAPAKRRLSRRISYVMGHLGGTGQPFVTYPQLTFQPTAFFALGSPIGMFVTVRGIDGLGEDFHLPTCPAFFNIFHPYDPVAYRIESLINPDLALHRPVLIPHHKGRKRMHLELKETMARVGADLKQKLVDSMKGTWNTLYQLAMFHKSEPPPPQTTLEHEVDRVLEEHLKKSEEQQLDGDTASDIGDELSVGKLNGGRRIDYVLQEAPLESFNEYLSAVTSHVCYWESEDTMLMILKEIYNSIGVNPDTQVPQATMVSTESFYSPSPKLRPPPFSSYSASQIALGMDPTAPPSEHRVLGPPPMSGFVRKY